MELRKTLTSALALSAVALAFSTQSCDVFPGPDAQGEIRISFSGASYLATKSEVDIPDTNSFILTVTDPNGEQVFKGKYGSSPESMMVNPGSYTISVVSCEFSTPKFSSPQYGDKQIVVVNPGRSCYVELLCRQMNSGVRLKISPDFLSSYPNGSLLLKNTEGKLLYSYTEKRIAYFKPGNVSLVLSDGGTDKILFSRALESQEILTLNLSAPQSSRSGVSVAVDTSRKWSYEDYVIGGGSKGGGKDHALDVSQARASTGSKEVWVYGYIVGGDLSSSKASFKGPFTSRTNIILASRSSVTDKSSCLSVQLQKGNIRDALNLVDNPDILGKEVFLKGDIVEAYYGICGIQNITEYEFK